MLERGKNKFMALDVSGQLDLLIQILNLSLICDSANADFTAIGEGSGKGILTINKNISGYSEFKLIHYSVTGLYKKEVDLLTV
jgi:CRISPR-associated endonuclease Csn1